MFPLLARQRLGLFYNMPVVRRITVILRVFRVLPSGSIEIETWRPRNVTVVGPVFGQTLPAPAGIVTEIVFLLQIPGCHGSSLFRAFHQHLMHRLKIEQDGPLVRRT